MVRLLIVVIGLVFTSGLKAQEWFPVGATWYYNQIILLQGETYVQFEVTGDTILQGKNCKILSGGCSCAAPGPGGYFYQEGDKVYAYDAEADSFRVFYDFTLEAGDTIAVSYTHLRAHETVLDLVCRLLLEKKKTYLVYK